MGKSITRSVGKGGVNLKSDVTNVQWLLNKVPPNLGGPAASLMVDGLSGPKTNDAIKQFQVRQFGLSFADGRVDPNGRTLAKLNDFDMTEPPLTTSSILLCPHGGAVNCIPTGPLPLGPAPGAIPLKTTDPAVVVGCPFPTPCVRVKWVGGMSLTLDARSIGLCLSAASVPQGSVVVAKV